MATAVFFIIAAHSDRYYLEFTIILKVSSLNILLTEIYMRVICCEVARLQGEMMGWLPALPTMFLPAGHIQMKNR